jgi:hypothetical protein
MPRKPLNYKSEIIHATIASETRQTRVTRLGKFISTMNAIRDFWHDLSWDLRCALRDIGMRLSAAFR